MNFLSILLYIGKEKYEYLSLAVSQIINELDEIKDGFKDCDDVIWTVELFFLVTGNLWRWLWELRLQIQIFFVYIVNVQKNYAPI